jgi:hypothetical protein
MLRYLKRRAPKEPSEEQDAALVEFANMKIARFHKEYALAQGDGRKKNTGAKRKAEGDH